jgi:hypothetical protein
MTVMICVCVCVYCGDMSYTNFVNNEENKESLIIQLLNIHTIRSSLSMHVYFRDHTQLECRDALILGLKTHSAVDVPVDDTQRGRAICAAQACPLHDHMLHELDQQFLNQASILCEQEVLNPQLPSTYH